MKKDEIINYALRYIAQDEIIDFPFDGDLFAMFARKIRPAHTPSAESKWMFAGYNICSHYQLDTESKPEGKWIWFNYATLVSYPPRAAALKLQPPHIVKGLFCSADRSHEFKIVKISSSATAEPDNRQPDSASVECSSNILSFPFRGKKPSLPKRPGKSRKPG